MRCSIYVVLLNDANDAAVPIWFTRLLTRLSRSFFRRRLIDDITRYLIHFHDQHEQSYSLSHHAPSKDIPSQFRLAPRNLITRPTLPEHLPEITDHFSWDLPRREMTTSLLLTLKHRRSQRPPPNLGHNSQLLRTMHQPQLHLRNPLVRPIPMNPSLGRMHRLIVNPQARRRARTAEVVDAHPGENFVVGPGVGVCPVV